MKARRIVGEAAAKSACFQRRLHGGVKPSHGHRMSSHEHYCCEDHLLDVQSQYIGQDIQFSHPEIQASPFSHGLRCCKRETHFRLTELCDHNRLKLVSNAMRTHLLGSPHIPVQRMTLILSHALSYQEATFADGASSR